MTNAGERTMPPAEKSPWFARLYDPLMAPVEILAMRRARRAVVADAPGLVLEVGAGTGLNLPHYRAAREVAATDADPAMLLQARPRAAAARVPVRLAVADAQALPFPDAAFDTVVATCVFCTVPDPEQGFRELRRVLKPGGELRLLEHVRAPSPRIARLQDRVTPLWSRIAGGCRLNRPTLETARRAGFRVEELETRFGGVVIRARLRVLPPSPAAPEQGCDP
jgi:ubiquinone/menaquinone biosynthesis C-methylase UbiE